MAKFECEVIWCAEEKGNRKAAAIFGVDESNVRLWQKHKTAINGCEGGEGSVSCPSHSLPPGKTRYPLYRRLGGPQGRSGQVWKIGP